MSNSPDAIRADIEQTRRELGTDVDALADKVSPSKIIDRQTDKVEGGLRLSPRSRHGRGRRRRVPRSSGCGQPASPTRRTGSWPRPRATRSLSGSSPSAPGCCSPRSSRPPKGEASSPRT